MTKSVARMTTPYLPEGEDETTHQRVRALVRDIRAEVKNLKVSVDEIQEKGRLAETETRERQVQSVVNEAQVIFARNRDQIASLFEEVHAVLRADPEVYDAAGDELTALENTWERARGRWPAAGQTVDEILARAQQINQHFEDIIFRCGRVTIPARANDHMSQMRLGQWLDFHKTFVDELDKVEDRVKVLEFMYSHSAKINGVVDVPAGRVYKASQNKWRRRGSYLLIIGAGLAGVIFILLSAWLAREAGLTWPVTTVLLKSYAALLLGSLAHIVVEGVKQARAQTEQSFRALDDWLIWVHIKELAIVGGVISLWIALIGLAYMNKGEVGTAFFVGYSIDSFIDLFLDRFTSIAGTKAQAITERIKQPA